MATRPTSRKSKAASVEKPALSPEGLQRRELLSALRGLKRGEFETRLPEGLSGIDGQIADTLNGLAEQLESFSEDVEELGVGVGQEGKVHQRIPRGRVRHGWARTIDAVNGLVEDVTGHSAEMARVIQAVCFGDLTQSVPTEVGGEPVRGEFLRYAEVVNSMVDQLDRFGAEVSRVAKEVGVEGKLGAQASVRGAGGTWKELIHNVNLLANNLTDQVRDVAMVTTAVARGDLSKKITVDVKGEVRELKETVNTMVDQLNSFGAEVTHLASDVGVEGKLGGQANVPGVEGVWRTLTNNVNLMASNLTDQVRSLAKVATAVTKGDLTQTVAVDARGEVAVLMGNINQMIQSLADTTSSNNDQNWLKTNLAKFALMLQGQRDLETVSTQTISELCTLVSAQHGVLYMGEHSRDGRSKFTLFAAYAYREREGVATSFEMGEGLVGQCALDMQINVVSNPPADYIRISSGLGEAPPTSIVMLPVVYDDEVKAVIELAAFEPLSKIQLSFLEQLSDALGVVFGGIQAQVLTGELLLESQRLTEELQTQQEELQQSNEELEEKAHELRKQKEEVELKNLEVEDARIDLEEKAEQLALTSKYKSEFLANMSHELRTPLNSLLILSQQLALNGDGNLCEKQVKFATTIYESGNDLLHLINEVLDLAKVESGTMGIDIDDVELQDVVSQVERSFSEVAHGRGVGFEVEVDQGLVAFRSDERRLHQILRNLLSNAFKFTDEGTVTLKIQRVLGGLNEGPPSLVNAKSVIAFVVTDSGIGIPEDKQRLIFEAFQQAEGSSNRHYGGTGLGLSISREICSLLGGALSVESTVGVGSTFTLHLPVEFPELEQKAAEFILDPVSRPTDPRSAIERSSEFVEDDRHLMVSSDRKLLVVEDDAAFAAIMRDQARERGFKVVVCGEGRMALSLAKEIHPDAITLDLELPDLHGWVILDRLKHHPATRHIPVHIVSAGEDASRGLAFGAIATLQKPLDQKALSGMLDRLEEITDGEPRHLLVIEDDEVQRESICELIGNGDVVTTAVANAKEALAALEVRRFDCIVLDLKLPGMNGFDLIEEIKGGHEFRQVPVIVYTGRELNEEEERRLNRLAETVIVKGIRSPERLLDETALFLHRVEGNLPEPKQQMLRDLRQSDPSLHGKRVLIVDDDPRNLFATTSILENHGVDVLQVENGADALNMLEGDSGIQLVLMDIMMPEMDGYETIVHLRKRKELEGLPVIALTAKAMTGDREKCIAAGASDYITKPLDVEQFISLLRVWLAR